MSIRSSASAGLAFCFSAAAALRARSIRSTAREGGRAIRRGARRRGAVGQRERRRLPGRLHRQHVAQPHFQELAGLARRLAVPAVGRGVRDPGRRVHRFEAGRVADRVRRRLAPLGLPRLLLPAPPRQLARPRERPARQRAHERDLTRRHAVGREPLRDEGIRERRERDARAARTDGGEQRVGVRRDEHQRGVVGRLLQRLQERVLGLRVHGVGGVDDHHPTPSLEPPQREPVIDEVAHLVDHDVLGGRPAAPRFPSPRLRHHPLLGQVEDVGVGAARDLAARPARAAGPVGLGRLAIHALCEKAGGGRLAHTLRAAEEVGVVQRAARQGGPQRAQRALLADELRERHGAAYPSIRPAAARCRFHPADGRSIRAP